MKLTPLSAFVAAAILSLSGCSSAYYGAMEKIGFAKREILVDRVEKTRTAQTEAKEQFASALERFLAVTKVETGDLQKKYDELNREFTRSESRAKEVRDRIAAVDDVAEALFNEWKQELGQFSDANLKRESQRQFDLTRKNYDELIRLMRRSAERMDPVLRTFHDQVLFLKHNLNALAIASLSDTHRALQADISQLIADMDASIKEADTFIKGLKAAR